MKHLHMLLAVVIIVLFVYQSAVVLLDKSATTKAHARKDVKISTHIAYALIILTGAIMVQPLVTLGVPVHWVMAKVVLLVAAISASIKAFRPTATLAQSRMGIFVATIAYAGIFFMAYAKPANLF